MESNTFEVPDIEGRDVLPKLQKEREAREKSGKVAVEEVLNEDSNSDTK